MKLFIIFYSLIICNYFKLISCQSKNVIVFTAWNFFSEKQFGHRLDNHQEYAQQHGYEYVMFVDSLNSLGEAPPSHRNVKFIEMDQSAGWHGWLKVIAFKNAFEIYPDAKLYFYIDMDCLFHNIMTPLKDFVINKPQSIFLQLNGLGMPIIAPTMTQSQSILLKNNPISREFVKKWEETREICPNINLEQGAMYATIAFWYDGKSRQPFEQCYHICKNREEYIRPNGEYNMCYRRHMTKYNNTDNEALKDIYIYGYNTLPFYSPRDGFTIDSSDWYPHLKSNSSASKSCPLTIHRNKEFTLAYKTNKKDCSKK